MAASNVMPVPSEDHVADRLCASLARHDGGLDLHSSGAGGETSVMIGRRDDDGGRAVGGRLAPGSRAVERRRATPASMGADVAAAGPRPEEICGGRKASDMKRLFWACALAVMAGAARAAPPLLAALAANGDSPAAPWHGVGMPGQTKPLTRFTIDGLDGRRVLRVDADSSYGHLVHPLPAGTRARTLSWRWRLDVPIPRSNLLQKDGDDSPVKVCALFDLPIAAVPFVERQLLRLSNARSSEALPAASVCYVWDAHLAPGTLVENAFTRRVRFIVLRGPESALHTWLAERRDVAADFMRLFGDEAAAPPPLVGISVGADADNTQSRSLAYVDEIDLR